MFKRPVISIVFLILITLQILFCIYILFDISSTLTNISAMGKEYGSLSKELKLNLFTFMTLFVLLVSFIFIAMKILLKKTSFNVFEKENFIVQQQKEIEKLSKMVKNLTQLYNSTVQYESIRTEFFSNIAHEFKTPLSVILGAIQLMDQKRIGIERRKSAKHLGTIKQNCYRLLRLINNILDISRLDSGHIKVNMVNCNIVCLIEEITQSVIPFAQQKNISVEFDTNIEEIITAVDIDKIERILLNLLSNAIKFTRSGGKVWVNIEGKENQILISVKDTGTGIPKEMLTKIFDRFGQVNNLHTREFEGSGIGLSLVKSFIEIHGGSIEVNSEENMGSEFIVGIPVRLCESSIEAGIEEETTQTKIVQAINIEFSDIYSVA
ncbi:MAG: HAMP domain-containing histidine kinase [Clostridia bacterium]|nr:HAMP domain-containing histidine kinase [Clostridia bacterium]